MKITRKLLIEAVRPDDLQYIKETNTWTFRRGFFYTQCKTSEDWSDRVSDALKKIQSIPAQSENKDRPSREGQETSIVPGAEACCKPNRAHRRIGNRQPHRKGGARVPSCLRTIQSISCLEAPKDASRIFSTISSGEYVHASSAFAPNIPPSCRTPAAITSLVIWKAGASSWGEEITACLVSFTSPICVSQVYNRARKSSCHG